MLSLRVTFWGVRGLMPCPGRETERYGGNTSCVSVDVGTGDEHGRIILDAGTGIVALGRGLEATPRFAAGKGRATLLLSHLHWDHIQGFPFCPLVHHAGTELHIVGPASGSAKPTQVPAGAEAEGLAGLEGALERQMNPHYSPLETLRNVGAHLTFQPIPHTGTPSPISQVGPVDVSTHYVAHGQTGALAYRLSFEGRTVVYVPDIDYGGRPADEATLSFFANADLLIHDATRGLPDVVPSGAASTPLAGGYASAEEALDVGLASGARHLVLFHHHPEMDDAALDAVARASKRRAADHGMQVSVAAEGLVVDL